MYVVGSLGAWTAWFAQDTWWAWLPTREGSSIWRRTSDGWQRQTQLDGPLQGLPGRADVWNDGDTVRAVLVDDHRLAVATLVAQQGETRYAMSERPVVLELMDKERGAAIETATIARDGQRRWWIAYPWNRRMWVRSAFDGPKARWSEPLAVSGETSDDDLCAVVTMSGQIALVWSDQAGDAMCFRAHRDDAESNDWGTIETIDHGHRTADDHINAIVDAGGTLYLATKNSVDRVGHTQLVLRVRTPNGQWQNLPYAIRTECEEPSRPIALLSHDPDRLWLLHTLYGRGDRRRPANRIVVQSVSTDAVSATSLQGPARLLIGPIAALNNVTGCKSPLPIGQPWIMLASDESGRVYEGRIVPEQ